MSTKKLREERASVWAQMQETRAAVDADGWTDELRAKYDAQEADMQRLSADIEREEKGEALSKRFDEIDEQTRHVDENGTETRDAQHRYDDAFRTWLAHGNDGLDMEQRQLLVRNVRPDLFPGGSARGAQSSGTPSTGGYTVPEGFWNKVTETLKYYGGIQQAGAEVIRTDSGNDLPWPTNDDTASVGAILGENVQLTTEDELDFGVKQLGAYMYTSKWIKASMQFLQDTALDAESFIARKAGTRLGRIWNTHFTTGTATTQPQGLIVGATAGGTCAASGTIAYEDLIDLQHSVDVAYRMLPGCGWMMNDLVLATVRKIKDDDGRPLWQPSVIPGTPDTLLGFPVYVNNDMSSTVASTDKLIGFGNANAAYVIRYVNGAGLIRTDQRFIDYLQIGFLAYARADGLVQDASAFKTLVGKNS